MKFPILFFVVLVGFVAPMVSAFLSSSSGISFEMIIDVNQTIEVGSMGPLPIRPSGPVTVSLTSVYSVEVCLQEYVTIQGDLQACNPGGYFLFNTNSTSQANFFALDEESISSLFGGDYQTVFVGDDIRTEVKSATLRGGSPYYISARVIGSALTNETAYFSLNITWDPTPCPGGQIGVGDMGCTAANNTVLSTVKQYSIGAMTSQYFSVVLGSDDNSYLHTTVTPLNNASIYRASDATNSTPSMDVEIRRQAAPQNGIYDANATLDNGAYVIALDSPVPNTTYYILVSNNENRSISYNLESIAQTCGAGLFGPNCTNAVTDLTNVENATKEVGKGEYQYFSVKRSTLVVGVGTQKLDEPAPTLLASVFSYPSNETALLVSYNKTVNFISAHNPSGSADATWYVSVWANEGQEYYIWANSPCPNNCTGINGGNTTHGTCDVDTGMCDCSKGYGDLFCDKSGLALAWIIIIVIVCAIILAIAIGVPVACFLRNRRRARYERV